MGLSRRATVFFLLPFLWSVSCGGPDRQSLPSPLSHGDWVSSGGERFKDANNPWWVKNTKHVKYCVQIDEAGISAPKEKILHVIESAFHFWKTEFARTSALISDPFKMFDQTRQLGVGTQELELTDCDGAEDLRIQLGYGTLTEDQKAYLKDPLHFIGIAVRTSYDEVELKGKGFLFIGSDQGEHRFAPDTQAEGIWKYDLALYLALLHELGHVFGLPHIGSSRYALMGADLLELFTSQQMLPFVQTVGSKIENPRGYFLPKNEWEGCGFGEDLKPQKAFFQTPESDDCLVFKLDEATREMAVFSYKKDTDQKTAIGKIDQLDVKLSGGLTAGVMLMLNDKQNVFDKVTSFGTKQWMLMGPFIAAGSGGGSFVSSSGSRSPLHIEIGAEYFLLSGIVGGVDTKLIRFTQ